MAKLGFSWTFIASILPDIRDRSGDAATGVLTIPVILGVSRTRFLLTGFNILSGALILAACATLLSWAVNAVILASLAYSQACILVIGHTGNDDLVCDVISDGQFIVIALACVLILSQAPGGLSVSAGTLIPSIRW